MSEKDYITTPLEPNAVDLFPLPPYAQRAGNIYSMANYSSFTSPLLEALAPKTLCEIGSELGGHTLFLADYCRRKQAKLLICDPNPAEKPELADVVEVHKKKSLDFLKNAPVLDVVFVDGDHHYEVVLKELEALAKIEREGGKRPFLFVHDVGWPCGRRDFYCDPSDVTAPHPHSFELGLSSFSVKAIEGGASAGGYYHKALESGGSRNGILTAVEDFVAAHPDWRFHTTFIVNGLAMLWRDEDLDDRQKAVLKDICEHLDWAAPLFAVLELSRFMYEVEVGQERLRTKELNNRLETAGQEWQRCQAYIKELEERREYYRDFGRKSEAYVKELEQIITGLNRPLPSKEK
ncbi:MAG: class I SAM-dependent methyltransferase [Proteobacteria bacterium]|nr:class I SAM-dependent methyltransferase [Pseudomonadota bacterium]